METNNITTETINEGQSINETVEETKTYTQIFNLTKEQKSIFNRQKKIAREYFGILGDNNMVLHHKDTSLRYTDVDRYIQWNIDDLIVMTRGEHTTLHHKGKKGVSLYGDRNPNYGKKHPGLNTGNPKCATATGKHWYNNGTENILTFECPEGFIKGRIVNQNTLNALKEQSELNRTKLLGNKFGIGNKGNKGRKRIYNADGTYYFISKEN